MLRLFSCIALTLLLGQGAGLFAQDPARGAAAAPPRAFIRGDSNRDARMDIADPINTLNGIFLGIGNAFQFDCRDRPDANDDGTVDISDPVYTLFYLFGGGESPPAPGPQAGQDPTADLLICFE